MARFKNSFPQPGDPRRDALARALQFGGMELARGAGTQGFGALADAVPAATYGYGEGLQQARRQQEEEERRRREEQTRRREDLRWEHTMEAWERARDERERERAETEAGRVAEKERREAMIQGIRETQGDNAARRAALLSPSKLEAEYLEATGESEPAGAPTTRNFPDGSLRQWNPASKSWEVLQHEPRGEEPGSGLTPGQLRNEAQEIANREVGTFPQWAKAMAPKMEKERDKYFAMPGEVDLETGRVPYDPELLRKEYNKRWQESFDRAMQRLSGAPNPTDVSNLTPGRQPEIPARAAGAAPTAAGGAFEQVAGHVIQQLEEQGAPPQAREKVQEVIGAVESAVPPEVRDSPEFIRMLQQEIASGKDPSQIAREILEAFGGGS